MFERSLSCVIWFAWQHTGVFFFKGRCEIKIKGQFSGINPRNFERVKLLHVSACFHPSLHTSDMRRVFKYSFQIRWNEKYDAHRKLFDTSNLAFTRMVLYLIWRKIAFCFNKGCLLNLTAISVEKRVFFSSRIREKRASSKLGHEHGYALTQNLLINLLILEKVSFKERWWIRSFNTCF